MFVLFVYFTYVCRVTLNYTKMKKVIRRPDLMKKMNFSKQYGINRVTLDKRIKQGLIPVERIDGTDFIRLNDLPDTYKKK